MLVFAKPPLPALPLVLWDIIVTPAGPVILQGNRAGNWILASLPGLFGPQSALLSPLPVEGERRAKPLLLAKLSDYLTNPLGLGHEGSETA